MNYVILAGGSGTRLWPMSRSSQPKQLAKLVTDVTMLEDTVKRLEGVATKDNLYISTNDQFAPVIAKLLPSIPQDHYIIEPAKRDTGPAMAFVAAYLGRHAADEPMVFVPSDHYIQDAKRYRQTFQAADQVVKRTGKMVSIGIQPTVANPHLGYLKIGGQLFEEDGIGIYESKGQVEKPDVATAQRFLDEGTYLWNANYFTWTPAKFIAAYQAFAGEGIGQHLEPLMAAIEQGDRAEVARLYGAMEKISIDYAVMEKIDHDQVVTIRGDFGWADLGSWDMLHQELEPQTDADGNLVRGDWHGLETTGCVVYGPERKILATLGVHDLVIIDTPDALLVTTREKSKELKRIVELLKERGLDTIL